MVVFCATCLLLLVACAVLVTVWQLPAPPMLATNPRVCAQFVCRVRAGLDLQIHLSVRTGTATVSGLRQAMGSSGARASKQ
jgi:hypothetical protein